MNIFSFKCGPLLACAYLVWQDGQDNAILIDAGGNTDQILSLAKDKGLNIGAVFLTHGHFDHVGACFDLQKLGAKIYLHKSDEHLVATDDGECGFGISVKKFTPDVLLNGDEELDLFGLKIKVLHTPGHTKGGVCYVIENNIFSGDTLFLGSYGRVDLGDGDIDELKCSIVNVLFALNGEYDVYPGHERKTSLNFERKFNPILYA